MEAPTPTTAKSLSRFIRQIRWHSQMIRYLVDVAIPLHTAVNKTPSQWTTLEQDAYDCLKKMLTKVPVVQPPDGGQTFSRFRRRFRCCDWQSLDAIIGAKLV